MAGFFTISVWGLAVIGDLSLDAYITTIREHMRSAGWE